MNSIFIINKKTVDYELSENNKLTEKSVKSKLPAKQKCLLVQTPATIKSENYSFEESCALLASKKEVVDNSMVKIFK